MAKQTVDTYRVRFSSVVKMWKAQEGAAIEAVLDAPARIRAGHVTWFVEGSYLYCQLPSGRRLAYPEPMVQDWETSWGTMKTSLTFCGVDPYSRKWKRRAAYGGLLVENITQAVARDIMAEAVRRCESTEYVVVLTVHDELIAECAVGHGSVQEFTRLVAAPPVWALDCPIEAEGFSATRYTKG
jgi:DNA polymerase